MSKIQFGEIRYIFGKVPVKVLERIASDKIRVRYLADSICAKKGRMNLVIYRNGHWVRNPAKHKGDLNIVNASVLSKRRMKGLVYDNIETGS
jgi:hypothetical protein